MMKIGGVDPGRTGALACITAGEGILRRRIEIYDLPYDDNGRLRYRAYRDLLVRLRLDAVWVENVWPRSSRAPKNKGEGMGFIAGSKFMDGVGALKGISACYVEDSRLVTPQKWMEVFGLVGMAGKERRDTSRGIIVDLFPEAAPAVRRGGDDGRAAAGLIAAYGCVQLNLFKLSTV